jgi:hypothetical protein
MSKPTATPTVLSVSDWNPSSIKYMQPKINDRGGKSIAIISTQTNRYIHVSTPMMMTWGISDYTDEKTGESNGSFKMSLNFPRDGYEESKTTEFLNKMKAFETQILDDAVKNSELWFGEQQSREVSKHMLFPSLKYPKDKITKKTDYSKAPSLSMKVPTYNDKWSVEVYDADRQMLFPSKDNMLATPMDYVPKSSNVACVVQCGGIWWNGKSWGVTWKLVQCVVKPQQQISIFGECHIPDDVLTTIKTQEVKQSPQDDEDEEDDAIPATTKVVDTVVEDSDVEDEEPQPKPVKKVVKKAEPASVAVEAQSEAPKKKVIKKKV